MLSLRVPLFNRTGAMSLQFAALWRGFMLSHSAEGSVFVYIYFQLSLSKDIDEKQRHLEKELV